MGLDRDSLIGRKQGAPRSHRMSLRLTRQPMLSNDAEAELRFGNVGNALENDEPNKIGIQFGYKYGRRRARVDTACGRCPHR